MTREAAWKIASTVYDPKRTDDKVAHIADAILTACQSEADDLQAAVEAEREACAEAVKYWSGTMTCWADYTSPYKIIRDRGATSALDEERRKASESVNNFIKSENLVKEQWPYPTPEMLKTDIFKAVWDVIKSWDINVPEQYGGYCGATGNHVRAILDAIEPNLAALQAPDGKEGQ